MTPKLFYKTVTPQLSACLKKIMASPVFADFRLVGGTSLSLQLGHRLSVDLDLFTDAKYESINFKSIDEYLRSTFAYVDANQNKHVGMGVSYFAGENENNAIKLDIYYTDVFIRPQIQIDEIRMASVEDIIAMKVDVIARGGRKKDFWDLHELSESYTLDAMLNLHQERYPYTHDRKEIIKAFTNFTTADTDFDPVCLRHKYWEIIKLDMADFVNN